MFCKNCGNEIGNALFCPHCKQQAGYDLLIQDATHYSPENQILDVPNIFMIILAFFIPLFGFIYYFTHIARFKVKSRAYGISSLSAVGTTLIVMIIALIIAIC